MAYRRLLLAFALIAPACTKNAPAAPMFSLFASGWPNEPSGVRMLTSWGLDQAPPAGDDVAIPGSGGWRVVRGFDSALADARVELRQDPTARFSPPGVYELVYPEGMVEGRAPATVYYPNLNAREAFAGFWWKASKPFDLGPNGNKIAFLFNGGGDRGGQQFIALLPDGRLHVLLEYPNDVSWRHPNVSATRVTLGEWHQIEWHVDLDSGVLQWWLDGELQGSYQDVRNPVAFDMFQFSPTWGGNSGARKRETDRYWFDHVYLSARR